MRILNSYTCKEHSVTADSRYLDMVGEVTFIGGRLAMITASLLLTRELSPLSKQVYYTHKILAFNHITNEV